MPLDRRRFLGGALAALGVAAAAPRLAHAHHPNLLATANPNIPTRKVLEVHLNGGLSAFETLLGGNFASHPASGDMFQEIPSSHWRPFALFSGALGTVRVSRGFDPLVAMSSWNTTIAAMTHNLEPHEAAVPLLHTGTSLGRANHAGMAAIVNHVYGGTQPVGFVLHGTNGGGTGVEQALVASSTAGMGAESYPVLLDVNASGVVNRDRFDRTLVRGDSILDALDTDYRRRLSHGSDGLVESDGYGAYRGTLRNAGASAGYSAGFTTYSNMSPAEARMHVAADLLQNRGARYVCVVEGAFDTHGITHVGGTSAALHDAKIREIFSALNWVQASLSNTVVVFTTEFGRQPEGGGTGHYPQLYAQVAMAPPTSTVLRSPKVLDAQAGVSDPFLEPSYFRAGVLRAVGINGVAALGLNPATGLRPLQTGDDDAAYQALFT